MCRLVLPACALIITEHHYSDATSVCREAAGLFPWGRQFFRPNIAVAGSSGWQYDQLGLVQTVQSERAQRSDR